MTEIKFSVDGVDGEFAADLDELKSYKTVKQFARSETDPAGMMDAMERIFMGRDEEYIEALGGTSYDMRRLCDAAFEAAKAKTNRLRQRPREQARRSDSRLPAVLRHSPAIGWSARRPRSDGASLAAPPRQLAPRQGAVPATQVEHDRLHALAYRAPASVHRLGHGRQEGQERGASRAYQDAGAARRA